MSERSAFDYAVLRLVPHVEREEFLNVGVVVSCPKRRFLGARIHIDEQLARALAGEVELALAREHFRAIEELCNEPAPATPLARLSPAERFEWVVAPRSTMIQTSPVHVGLCSEPEVALEHLFETLVLRRKHEAG